MQQNETKYYTVRTVPISNWKIVETYVKIDTSNTHIHDHSLFCLGTDTSRKKWRC